MHRRTTALSIILLLATLPLPVFAAEPARDASCSEFAAGVNTCSVNGCLVCTGGIWTSQPFYIGASNASCDTNKAGMTRYNASGNGITVRQMTPGVSTAGNYQATLLQAPVSGNTIIVPIGVWNDTVTSVTDNAGNTYNLAVSSLQNVTRTYIYYASNITSPKTPLTITVATYGEANIGAMEVEGLASSSAVDQTGTVSTDGGHTATVTTGGATSQAAELAVAVHDAAYDSNLGYSYGAGWNQLFVQNDSGCCNGTHSAYKILSSTGSVSHTWNYADPNSGYTDVTATIATFKASAGAGVLQICDGTQWVSVAK